MIRIAILEYEKETKEIAFALSRLFSDVDWVFRHYWKASLLARACQDEAYQVFFFDEMFRSPRLESVFVEGHPEALFVYVCQEIEDLEQEDQRGRVFYIRKSRIAQDLERISEALRGQSLQQDQYALQYGGVHVELAYEDILYLEKVDKMVYFYTRKGTFHKRCNMVDLEKEFCRYGFVRVHVSYMVNEKHILNWGRDSVELTGHLSVPVSRSQRRRLRKEKKEARENSRAPLPRPGL